MKRSPTFLIAALLLLSATSVIAQTPRNLPEGVHIDSVNVFYAEDEATITAYYQLNYSTSLERVGWLIPLSATPDTIELLPTSPIFSSFLAYSDISPYHVHFIPPDNPCGNLLDDFITNRGGDGIHFLTSDVEGAPQVLHGENAISWLANFDQPLSQENTARLAQYAAEGRDFLGVTLYADPNVLHSPVIAVTFPASASQLTLPLLFGEEVAATVWIFGDGRYTPLNFPTRQVDFSDVDAPSRVSSPYIAGNNPNDQENSYLTLRLQVPDVAITEYAGLTGIPLNRNLPSWFTELAAHYPYVTRIFMPLQSSDFEDVEFVRDPGVVSNEIDLASFVEPLDYWGCSTRTAYRDYPDPRFPEALPAGRTRIEDLEMEVAHPSEWQLSAFTVETEQWFGSMDVYAFSPNPVDESNLVAYVSGQDVPPMFVGFRTRFVEQGWHPALEELLAEFGYDQLHLFPDRDREEWRTFPNSGNSGAIFVVLTTDADWTANEQMYRAMLGYTYGLSYHLHPDLRYTLFLDHLTIGFPEGWTEHTQGDRYVIESETGEERAVIIRSHEFLGEIPFAQAEDYYRALFHALYDVYGTPLPEELDTLLADCCCWTVPPLAFQHDDRRGFLRIDGDVVVEVTTTSEDYNAVEPTLLAIADTTRGIPCG